MTTQGSDLRVLGFGSREWTLALPVANGLGTARPDVLVHGACGLDADEPFLEAKLRGADGVFHREAGRLGIAVDPYPAEWTRLRMRAGPARNAVMAPLVNAGIGCVTGRVGQAVGTKGHYLTNGSDDMARRLREAGVPVVIFREDGVEPLPVPRSGDGPLVGALRAVCWHLAGLLPIAPEVAAAGRTCKTALEVAKRPGPHPDRQEFALAIRNSIEALREACPRVTPWLAPVDALLAGW